MEKNNETKTGSLVERINQNESNQAIDLNEWAFDKIKGSDKKIRILELCCGTGKQTIHLLKAFPNAEISCLDISKDAIDTVQQNLKEYAGRMQFHNSGIDEFFNANTTFFDLVFCSYGLYYASDIAMVLDKIYASLNPGGRFIVLGPYGENNKQLFEALTDLGVELPEPVISSSSKFMYEKVLAFAIHHFNSIHVHTTVNTIVWNNTTSVMNYWKSSTFYEKSKEHEFQQKVEDEITRNGRFINEKRIMLIEAIKHD